MPKPGNWGDWAVIENKRKPAKKRKISCRMCSSFSAKTNRCAKAEFLDENITWRTCKNFYFKPLYDTAKNWNQLVKERGNL